MLKDKRGAVNTVNPVKRNERSCNQTIHVENWNNGIAE
jgi:hypothetical protein